MLLPLNPDTIREARNHFIMQGYAVIPGALDPAEIAAEVDWAIFEGCQAGFRLESESLTVTAAYVPMTTAETPASLSLLLGGASLALQMLGRPVVPFRAKGTVY